MQTTQDRQFIDPHAARSLRVAARNILVPVLARRINIEPRDAHLALAGEPVSKEAAARIHEYTARR